MFLIVGLGNPGVEYENTRHNLGFRAVEELAERMGLKELKFKTKCNALVGEGKLDGHKVIVAEPRTFMNLSGQAVHALASWYKILPDHLIIIHDDVDIEPGEIRVKFGGGAAGHHGIESVMNVTGTQDFIRIRIGIGREGPGEVTEYVLKPIPKEEREIIGISVMNAAQAAIQIVTAGLEAAKNKFNGLTRSH